MIDYFYETIRSFFQTNTPFEYFHWHAFIALIIYIVIYKLKNSNWAAALLGMTFYGSREYAQYEILLMFDYPGFWWPILTMICTYLSLSIIKKNDNWNG